MTDHREPLASQDARDSIARIIAIAMYIVLPVTVVWALVYLNQQHSDNIFRAQRNYIDCVKALRPSVPIQTCGTFPSMEASDD